MQRLPPMGGLSPAVALICALAAALLWPSPVWPSPVWPSPGRSAAPDAVDRRVQALLDRMTLEEKIGQLTLVLNGQPFPPDLLRQGRIGAMMNFGDAEEIAAAHALARQSRLGIPLLVGLDVVHGYRTLFPVPLAEAAAFDPDLSRLASEWAAREAAAAGIHWTFGPMADLARDVRWGRIVEGAGEDPYLASVITAARVEGFRAGGLATAAKHFAGYGFSEGGRDYDAVPIGPAEFRDVVLPPFRAAIRAGTESIMSAFTALDGVPATADPWLLTRLLRRELGFDGFVVSDFAGVQELLAHGVAADGAEAARKAILAGVDMEMIGGLYGAHLPDEVAAGRVPLSVIDEAAGRVLRAKVRLGLFERPDPDAETAERAALTPEARLAARQVARESLVLLRNRDAVLPIPPTARRIAVIGPLAKSARDQLGPHEAKGRIEEAATILDGITRRARSAGAVVAYAPGCDLHCAGADGFPAAIDAARASDMVIAVLGEPRDLTGEGASRAHLRLPGRQYELLDALVATGRKVALVLIAGRPLELREAAETVPAILMAWYPGTEGGPAIADVLFGDAGPGGRLPHSWPRTVGQVPLHYDARPSGRPTRTDNRFTLNYIDEDIRPLFPFGWGLDYTGFAYSDLEIVTPRVRASEAVEIRVTVTNTGARAGKEVAQLYVRDPVASRSRPLRQLKAFRKIVLAPGEARTVAFRVPARELGFHLPDGSYLVEPGRFQVWAGGSALADLGGSFEVTEALRVPPD
mgnify:FL=1